MRFNIRLLLIALLLLLVAGVVALPVHAQDYKQQYEEALSLYNQGKVAAAIRAFRDLAEEDHSRADNAQYWIAEAYYRAEKYAQAIIEFDRTLTYVNTNKREDALYGLASCYEHLGKQQDARKLYRILLKEFPDTRHAPYVVKKLEDSAS